MNTLTFRFNREVHYVFTYALHDGNYDEDFAPVFGIALPSDAEEVELHPDRPVTTDTDVPIYTPFSKGWPCHDCRHLAFDGLLNYYSSDMQDDIGRLFPNQMPDVFELQVGGRHRLDFEGYAKVYRGNTLFVTLHFDYEVVISNGRVSWIMYANPPEDKRLRYGVGTPSIPTWWCWLNTESTINAARRTKSLNLANKSPTPKVSFWDLPYVSERVVNDVKSRIEMSSETRSKFDWGQLCGKAAESARGFTGNGIAFAKEQFQLIKAAASFLTGDVVQGSEHLGSLLRSFIRKATRARSADERAKQIANAYLSMHYGARLTIADESELNAFVKSLEDRQMYQRLGAEASAHLNWSPMPYQVGDLSVDRRVTSIIRSYSDDILHVVDSVSEAQNQLLQRIKRSGYEYDVLPTLENIWDLIPFSFVVDWFLPIGAQLGTLETRGYVETLPVIACFYTDTWQWRASAPSFEGWQSLDTINYRYYERTCSDRMIPPCLVSPESPIGRLKTHWVEGLAVVIQNL